MKLIRKVPALEVKRTFIISDFVSQHKYLRKHMGSVSPTVYQRRVKQAKEIILQLPETMLDMILNGEWHPRHRAYNRTNWYLAVADTSELGVWKRAGDLPLAWTKGSLNETAAYVIKALKMGRKSKKFRAYSAIPGIIKTALPVVQRERYLLPIAFQGGTGTKGRRGLKRKTRGDLDDGCMRSIAPAVSGKKKIKIYFGIPKKRR